MTDIVLVNWGTGSPDELVQREHLGLAYLSSFLESSGYVVCFFDGAFLGWDENKLVEQIIGKQPGLVGFSLFLNNTAAVLQIIERLRLRGLTSHITLGGHHATFNCHEILKDNLGVDSVVRGEGEEALAELAGRILTSQPWSQVANLAYLDKIGEVVLNPCRPLIANLDVLPFPSREPYAQALGATRVAAMVSSRGCYGNCSFCSIRAFYRLSPGKTWRWRSPANIVDEIEKLVQSYGVSSIIFLDDNFLGPGRLGRKRARAIAAELKTRSFSISWSIAGRPNDVDLTTLQVLQQAGLMRVDLGIESWVPRQLALYDKGITVEENDRAIAILERLGLEYRLYLMPVDPYVTPEELSQNLDNMRRQGLKHIISPFFNHLMPFRGTALAERLQRDGLIQGTPQGKNYLGPLHYTYEYKDMGNISKCLQQLDKEVKAAIQRIKSIFPWGLTQASENLFAQELCCLVGEFTLEIADQVIQAFQDDRQEEAADLVWGGLKEIAASLDLVVEAQQEGRFARFADLRVQLGERWVSYPPPEVKQLTELLL